jgi:hypothetical protein
VGKAVGRCIPFGVVPPRLRSQLHGSDPTVGLAAGPAVQSKLHLTFNA